MTELSGNLSNNNALAGQISDLILQSRTTGTTIKLVAFFNAATIEKEYLRAKVDRRRMETRRLKE